MALKFRCKQCNYFITSTNLKIGDEIRCQKCGCLNTIPPDTLDTQKAKPKIDKYQYLTASERRDIELNGGAKDFCLMCKKEAECKDFEIIMAYKEREVNTAPGFQRPGMNIITWKQTGRKTIYICPECLEVERSKYIPKLIKALYGIGIGVIGIVLFSLLRTMAGFDNSILIVVVNILLGVLILVAGIGLFIIYDKRAQSERELAKNIGGGTFTLDEWEKMK